MKHNFLFSLLFSALLAGTVSANAEDGTITFTGSIEDGTCAIASDSQAIDVDFGQVSVNQAGAPSTEHFKINLTNCPASVSNAIVSWSGQTVSNGIVGLVQSQKLAAYANGAAGALDNVAWIIAPGKQTDIDKNTAVDFTGVAGAAQPITEGNNSLEYTAGLSNATNGSLPPGDLVGDATYTISYN